MTNITKASYAVIYCRVSSTKQDFMNSANKQYNVCYDYCEKVGLQILTGLCMCESAYKKKRPGFEAMLDGLRQSPKWPIAVVVTSIDRIARNFSSVDSLLELLRVGKIELHIVDSEMILTSSSLPNEICSFKKAVAEAEEYSAWISCETKLTFQNLRERGIYPGKAPIGYSNIYLDSRKSIEPDEQAGKVQLLFDAFLQPEIGIRELLKIAQMVHLHTTAGASISRRTLIHMLQNPFYYGYMKSGGRLYRHNYIPLVNDMIFYAVQKKLDWELGKVANKETEVQVAA